METDPSSSRRRVQKAGLVLGPVCALVTYNLLPDSYIGVDDQVVTFSAAGRGTLAVMLWMAIWWLSEATHISVTALVPLAVFPLFRIANDARHGSSIRPSIDLSLHGWFLDVFVNEPLGTRSTYLTHDVDAGWHAPSKYGRRFHDCGPPDLSAFVSNTATTAMMLPIAVSVLRLVGGESKGDSAAVHSTNFATCLMLGIAYSASIGGVATIIGTPPNLFLVSFVASNIDEAYRTDITFAKWLLLGVPFALVFLPLVWFLLTRLIFPHRDTTHRRWERVAQQTATSARFAKSW